MSIQKRKIGVPKHINGHRRVSVKLMGNVSEISISDRLNSGATILPLSKDEYVCVSTGELKQFSIHAADRTQNQRNLEKTMQHLSALITTNVRPDNIECCRFLTLTYADNQRDAKEVYRDFKCFNQRFRRYTARLGLSYEYISVLEAQERGALHLHIICIFNAPPPFFDPSRIADIWGKGFISIKALDGNIDDIGRYLVSYLADAPADTNLPLESVTGKIKEVEVDGKKKRIVKGARLALIPAGTRIYRYSKGIKKPVVIHTPYAEALEYLSDAGFEKVHESAFELRDSESDFKSTYVRQVFKKYINSTIKRKEYH